MKPADRPKPLVSPTLNTPFPQKFTFVDPPMLIDVNNDGIDDLVSGCRDSSSDSTYWIGAFNGRHGEPLWRSQPLAWTTAGFRALATGVVMVGDGISTVRALNASTGAPMWTQKLTGVPTQVCASAAVVGIDTASNAIHVFDLADGSELDPSGSHGFCGPIYNTLSPDAPNFQVRDSLAEDEIPRHASSQKISGLAIERVLIPTTGKARVVLGHATRDRAVPSVAVLADKKMLWQSPIPSALFPHGAVAATPTAAVRRECIVVPYQATVAGPRRLTSFDLRTGDRRWDVALDGFDNGGWPIAVARDGQVFVPFHGSGVKVLSLQSGTIEYFIGEP
jgi:outer membrane protein assembly factor BamB